MTIPSPRKILVTTDLSTDAAVAYPLARSLAEAYKASLVLATFIDTSIQFGAPTAFETPPLYLPEALAAMKERTESQMKEELAKHFADLPPTVQVQSVVYESRGPVYYGIEDVLRDNGFDMVVMSSHGRSGIARTFLGSITEQVLRRSPIPVVVVPVRKA
jgi:nucleotide-binding universal stress UspA family protein